LLNRYLLIFAVSLIALPGYSLASARVVNPNPDRIKEVQSVTGATISCLLRPRRGVYVPGFMVQRGQRTIWRRSRTINQVNRVRSRLRDLRNSGAARRRIRRVRARLNLLRETLQQERQVCNSEPGDGPIIPSDPLAPLARDITRHDLELLLERAAFGHGPRSSNVMQAGLSSGLDAAISALTSARSEQSGILGTFETMGNTGTIGDMNTAIIWLGAQTRNPFQFKLGYLFFGNTWVLNSRGVDTQFTPSIGVEPLWQYYRDLREFGFEPDIKKMADDYLTSLIMLRQYNNTGNVRDAHNFHYAEALLGYILPGGVDDVGEPNFTFTDLERMAKVLSGWEVVGLPDGQGGTTFLPAFVSSDHAPGPHHLFSGTPNSCSADRIADYLNNCAFNKDGVSLFYSRRLLEFYLTPDPPESLIVALASEIRNSNYNLKEPLKKLFRSAIFYHDSYRDTVPKHPLETALSFLNILDLPFRIDAHNDGLRTHMLRAGYNITNTPAPFGYSNRDWTNMQTVGVLKNLCERAFINANNPTFPGDALVFGDLSWDPEDFLPVGNEISSNELISHVAGVLGIRESELTPSVLANYQYYVLHVRSSSGGVETDTFTPYNNVGDNWRKGVGIYCVMKLGLPFMMK